MPLTLVLSVGLDSVALATRNLLLQSEEYSVVSALSVKEAVSSFRNGDFDLVLLDNSLPTKDRDRLTCLIRASGSRVPVASVAPEHSHDDSFADAMLESDPNKLLMGMRSVLLKKARMSDYVSMTDAKGQRPRDLTGGPKASPVVTVLTRVTTCIDDLVADDTSLADKQMVAERARNTRIADMAAVKEAQRRAVQCLNDKLLARTSKFGRRTVVIEDAEDSTCDDVRDTDAVIDSGEQVDFEYGPKLMGTIVQ